MTSLKVKYADEILAAMAEKMEDKEFTNIFRKQASVEGHKELMNKLNDEKEFPKGKASYMKAMSLAKKYLEDGKISDSEFTGAKEAIGERFGASAVPPQMAHDKCKKCGCDPCKCEKEQDVNDAREYVAAQFAVKRLVSLADALDGHGFDKLANVIDETITKISKK